MALILILAVVLLAFSGAAGASLMSSTAAATPIIQGPNPANRAAFLAAIRMSEGTAIAVDPYSVLYGGGIFFNHADHPANTGEWPGASTQWGHTTAAGAYQFEVGTWNGLGGAAKYGDFSGPAQDAAALDLINQQGALGNVDAGDIAGAVARLGTQWASLPSSSAGQPTVQLSAFQTSYLSNGGTLA